MQVQSARTAIVIASSPAFVMPKSRKRSSWPQRRVLHGWHAVVQA
jgi:hypothetical protein